MSMVAPMEWPSANSGGGQSGSTISRMKVSRSLSYSDLIEPAAAAIGGANEHGGAHGMAEREQRRRTIRQHDLAHEGLEIAVVFRSDRTSGGRDRRRE